MRLDSELWSVCVCVAIKQIHVRDVYLVAKLVGEKAMESEVTERITVNIRAVR